MTWTGAFMCGPYNHPEKGTMSVDAQVGFASFYTSQLRQAGIPWAVLASGHFIDETTPGGDWIADAIPLRNALLA